MPRAAFLSVLLLPASPMVPAVADDPNLFQLDDAMVTLGVGKNMVRAIRHWALAAGIVQELPPPKGSRARPLGMSALGRMIFGADGSSILRRWSAKTPVALITTRPRS